MLHLYKQEERPREERPRIVGHAKAKGPSAYMVKNLGSHGFLHKHFGILRSCFMAQRFLFGHVSSESP